MGAGSRRWSNRQRARTGPPCWAPLIGLMMRNHHTHVALTQTCSAQRSGPQGTMAFAKTRDSQRVALGLKPHSSKFPGEEKDGSPRYNV